MDRRQFFRSKIGGVAAGAAVRSWPFRAYFFPKQVMIAVPGYQQQPAHRLDLITIEIFRAEIPKLMEAGESLLSSSEDERHRARSRTDADDRLPQSFAFVSTAQCRSHLKPRTAATQRDAASARSGVHRYFATHWQSEAR